MFKHFALLTSLFISAQAIAQPKEYILLEIMWDDAVKGEVNINGDNIWQFPLSSKEEDALDNLPEPIKKSLNIHSFDKEKNTIRLYANSLFENKLNTLKYTYQKHTDEYIRYRPKRLGYYLYRTQNPGNKDSWMLMDYKQEPIDRRGEMTAHLNPFNDLVTFYIPGFKPMTDEFPSAADNVRSTYRELTIEIMEGDFTRLNTLNPAHELQFNMFKNKALLNRDKLTCRRGDRREAHVRFIDGAAFVTGNLASCSVVTKDNTTERVQFDYFQYQYNGKEWRLSDFLVRHPSQSSIFPDDETAPSLDVLSPSSSSSTDDGSTSSDSDT